MRTSLQNMGKVQTQEGDESQPGAKQGEHIGRISLLTDFDSLEHFTMTH